ncbi:MAG TPA: cupin domain-containing protein, partial [Solirubrobacteraceae bacterium]
VAGPLPVPDPSPRPATVVALADLEPRRFERGASRFSHRDAGRAAGSRRTGLKVMDIDAGARGFPPHCHSHDEELFVVLSGTGWVVLGDERHALRAGHAVARPAGTGVAHSFEAGDTGLQVLAYGTREPGDMAYHPRSGNLEIRGLGVVGRLQPVDFWDGEEAS